MIGRNNPLNIKYSPLNAWKGQCGRTRGFCNFRELRFGIRTAAYLLIVSYRRAGCVTYFDLISRFAPRVENPTSNYVRFVCDKCKVLASDVPKTLEDFACMIYYMWIFEQGKTPSLSVSDIEELLDNFGFLDVYAKSDRNS